VCYAVDDKTTFENIEGHVTEATRYSTRSEKFLVANKQDVDDHVVSDEEGAELAAKLHVSFHKTSAKSGDGVEDLFMQVARKRLASSWRTWRRTRREYTVLACSHGFGLGLGLVLTPPASLGPRSGTVTANTAELVDLTAKPSKTKGSSTRCLI